MEKLSDSEFGRLCRALLRYSMTGEEEELNGAEGHHLRRVYTQERRYQDSYEERIEARRAAGKLGAEKRWQNIAADGNAIANHGKHGKNKTENKNNTLPSDDGKSKGRAARFAPPTAEEVAAFAQEHTLCLDAAAFVDHYTANGWVVGKAPMRDWRAAARNWARRQFDGAPARKGPPVGSAGAGPLGSMEQEAVRRLLGGDRHGD